MGQCGVAANESGRVAAADPKVKRRTRRDPKSKRAAESVRRLRTESPRYFFFLAGFLAAGFLAAAFFAGFFAAGM